MKKKKLHILSIAAVILAMAVIFMLSAQPVTQSDKLSRGLAKMLLSIAGDWLPDIRISLSLFNHLLRKAAHFTAYFFLGFLGVNAFWKNGKKTRISIIVALFLCILFAFSDEAHQLFVHGRGAQLRDVAIDSAGAAAGILAYLFIAGLYCLWKSELRRSKQL